MTGPRRIEIVIDHLVVHGLGRRAAERAEEALAARLEELSAGWLDGSDPVPAPGRRERTRTSVTVARGRTARVTPDDLGRAVADAVVGAVGQGAPTSGTRRPAPAEPGGPR